ncbi:MAG TPA: hypothetical protein ENK91_09820, partial [Bacteroidetes bacterium]|nr:hypothetical protein [Bacteroidota bacterium]
MKRRLFILLLMINASCLFSQEYFNKIIPFDFGNPNPVQLFLYNQDYYIPVIYYAKDGDISTIVNTKDTEKQVYYYHYDNFDFSADALVNIKNNLYIYAKDRSIDNDIRIMKLNYDFSAQWIKSYHTNGEWNFPITAIALDEYIYVSFLIDFNNGKHREIGIKKIDTLGNEIWSKNYNLNDKLSFVWQITPSLDHNILISAGVNYTYKIGRYSQVTKIDTAGNIIWRTSGDEEFEDGATTAWITQLTDSSIVQSYKTNKWEDYDIWKNNFNYFPTRLKWYDKNGVPNHEILLTTPKVDQAYIFGIKAGKGDYFFAYGMY